MTKGRRKLPMQAIELDFLRRVIVKDQFPVAAPVGPAFFSKLIFRNPSLGQLLFVESAVVVALVSAGNSPSVFLADGDQPFDGLCDPFGGAGTVGDPRAMFMPAVELGIYIPSGNLYLNSVDAAAGETVGIRVQCALYRPVPKEQGKHPEPGHVQGDDSQQGYSNFPVTDVDDSEREGWDREGQLHSIREPKLV
jgi:hypothetical protein